MHTPITLLLLLLLGTLALTTTITTTSQTLGHPPAGQPPPPPPQNLTKTYEPNHLTNFITNKLSTPRKWMLKKPPGAPPPQPPRPIAPSTNLRPPYTDPIKLQRFIQDLRATRRPNPLRRRGIKSNSESLPLPPPPPRPAVKEEEGEEEEAVEAVMPKELTEAEFDAMFEEYRRRHDIAVGAFPKELGPEKFGGGGTECGGFIERVWGRRGGGVLGKCRRKAGRGGDERRPIARPAIRPTDD
ncbi:hypothetical protein B9Z19DRAFT_1174696 [Tuber borchii]|uniref:Uncharacterized protein n=1 Tax=Tuber borchii TaxID=42251 RepID=A0A2T6ZWJ1_TUBBO|nr:hypothetical protein B9Z19DRAFT_1174696 [Tuber borchii]